jgi:hypothetical protein
MLSVIYADFNIQAFYAERRYAERRYAERRYTERRYAANFRGSTERLKIGVHFMLPCTIKKD